MLNNLPLSLYIHFPWCVRKCPYCDFNSHESKEIPEVQYTDALIRDFERSTATESRNALVSIFMGGGTPSLFKPQSIARLLSAIGNRFDLQTCEITMEANPGTFDQSHFDGYAAAGVNRLSIGAQSFSATSLQALGRIHQPDDILAAFTGARAAGIQRINLDLMHGLPGQTTEMAMNDLKQATALSPEHISWYQLTIEPNTVFFSRPPILPRENTLEEISEAGYEHLKQAGFEQYEVSAFSRPGEASVHNVNYWTFGDYIGIGAGAHGKISKDGNIQRTSKSRVPNDYLSNPDSRIRTVHRDELLLEYLMNALRLNKGFGFNDFEARTGLPSAALDTFIERGKARGLLTVKDQCACPTIKGQRFLDELLLLAD